MSKEQKIATLIIGLLGLSLIQASAQTLQERLNLAQGGFQIFGGAAPRVNLAGLALPLGGVAFQQKGAAVAPVAPMGNPDAILKLIDTLDEAKVGVAAKFISIEPGKFKMGSPASEPERWDNETQHPVELTRGFEIQSTEVTQLQYFLVMGRNPSSFKESKFCDQGSYGVLFARGDSYALYRGFNPSRQYPGSLCANHPVEYVSWDEAQEFIKRLNNIQTKYTYRLPTEAEWEKAARAGSEGPYPFPQDQLDSHAWYYKNSQNRTHAFDNPQVKTVKDLSNMHGNVWEWVQDTYDKDYDLKDFKAVAIDPLVTPGSDRVIRGGSWYNGGARNLRSAGRDFDVPGYRDFFVGFRLARSPR